MFHQGVAPRHGISNDDDIQVFGKLLRCIALENLDALGFKQRTHGWISIGIAATNPVSQLAGDQRDTRHEGAAYTQYVQVHIRQQYRSCRWAVDAGKLQYEQQGKHGGQLAKQACHSPAYQRCVQCVAEDMSHDPEIPESDEDVNLQGLG